MEQRGWVAYSPPVAKINTDINFWPQGNFNRQIILTGRMRIAISRARWIPAIGYNNPDEASLVWIDDTLVVYPDAKTQKDRNRTMSKDRRR